MILDDSITEKSTSQVNGGNFRSICHIPSKLSKIKNYLQSAYPKTKHKHDIDDQNKNFKNYTIKKDSAVIISKTVLFRKSV